MVHRGGSDERDRGAVPREGISRTGSDVCMAVDFGPRQTSPGGASCEPRPLTSPMGGGGMVVMQDGRRLLLLAAKPSVESIELSEPPGKIELERTPYFNGSFGAAVVSKKGPVIVTARDSDGSVLMTFDTSVLFPPIGR
jgi:hypothetical protein